MSSSVASVADTAPVIGEEALLAALRADGGWVKPGALGATAQSEHYVVLRRLVRKGYVERCVLPGGGGRGAYEYRARRVRYRVDN